MIQKSVMTNSPNPKMTIRKMLKFRIKKKMMKQKTMISKNTVKMRNSIIENYYQQKTKKGLAHHP